MIGARVFGSLLWCPFVEGVRRKLAVALLLTVPFMGTLFAPEVSGLPTTTPQNSRVSIDVYLGHVALEFILGALISLPSWIAVRCIAYGASGVFEAGRGRDPVATNALMASEQRPVLAIITEKAAIFILVQMKGVELWFLTVANSQNSIPAGTIEHQNLRTLVRLVTETLQICTQSIVYWYLPLAVLMALTHVSISFMFKISNRCGSPQEIYLCSCALSAIAAVFFIDSGGFHSFVFGLMEPIFSPLAI